MKWVYQRDYQADYQRDYQWAQQPITYLCGEPQSVVWNMIHSRNGPAHYFWMHETCFASAKYFQHHYSSEADPMVQEKYMLCSHSATYLKAWKWFPFITPKKQCTSDLLSAEDGKLCCVIQSCKREPQFLSQYTYYSAWVSVGLFPWIKCSNPWARSWVIMVTKSSCFFHDFIYLHYLIASSYSALSIGNISSQSFSYSIHEHTKIILLLIKYQSMRYCFPEISFILSNLFCKT